jgi:thiol-disulfide isomerase/thioredoxin
MKKLAFLGLLFLLSACGKPADEVIDSTDGDTALNPQALFTAATAAVLAVDAMSCSFNLEGVFVNVDTTEFAAVGEMVLQKGVTPEVASIYINYTLTTLPDQVEMGTVASDGSVARSINRSEEIFSFGSTADGGAACLLRDNIPQGAVMREYLFIGDPFGAELDAAGYTVLEPEEIDGNLCNVVQVEMPPLTSVWWIDAVTNLPRANRISAWNPDGTGMEYTITLSDLNAEAQPDPAIFQLECPEGYLQEEIFGSIPEGSMAPLWTLATPEGDSLSLLDLRGKVVVMDFWATWCGPCQQVMPVLQELHETYGEELMVIGINTWENSDAALFMAENGFTYPILLNGDEVAQRYFVEGIPTFYVIASDGTVAFQAVGADSVNEEGLREIIGTLLGE